MPLSHHGKHTACSRACVGGKVYYALLSMHCAVCCVSASSVLYTVIFHHPIATRRIAAETWTAADLTAATNLLDATK